MLWSYASRIEKERGLRRVMDSSSINNVCLKIRMYVASEAETTRSEATINQLLALVLRGCRRSEATSIMPRRFASRSCNLNNVW